MNGRKDERTDEPADRRTDLTGVSALALCCLSADYSSSHDRFDRSTSARHGADKRGAHGSCHTQWRSVGVIARRAIYESRAYCVDRCAVYQPSAARQRGTKVCRYNWHSAGCPGWPFLTLKCYSFSNKIHRNNFIK